MYWMEYPEQFKTCELKMARVLHTLCDMTDR